MSPLEKRKELLRELLRNSETIRYSDHVLETGLELFKLAKERGLEGIIAKRRDSQLRRQAILALAEVQNNS